MFHTENARLLSESAVFALWVYSSQSRAFPGVTHSRPCSIRSLPNRIWWGEYPDGVGRSWYAWMARHMLVSQLRPGRSRGGFHGGHAVQKRPLYVAPPTPHPHSALRHTHTSLGLAFTPPPYSMERWWVCCSGPGLPGPCVPIWRALMAFCRMQQILHGHMADRCGAGQCPHPLSLPYFSGGNPNYAADAKVQEAINYLRDGNKRGIDKYLFLRDAQHRNPRLFYGLLSLFVQEVLPFVYTPTVGEACQKYSNLPIVSTGLTFVPGDRGHMLQKLRSWPNQDIKVRQGMAMCGNTWPAGRGPIW